jgi:hypothetical protein
MSSIIPLSNAGKQTTRHGYAFWHVAADTRFVIENSVWKRIGAISPMAANNPGIATRAAKTL